MINIWILLWVLLSAFVAGAFVWSMNVLFAQKKSWEKFASKYKLKFDQGKLFSSPAVHGMFNGLRVNVYSEQQATLDARGSRFRSVVEIMGTSTLPMSGAIASGDLVNLVEVLELPDQFVPKVDLWSPGYLAKTDSKKDMDEFLSEERMKSMHRLFKNERSSFLTIFDTEDLLLRYETNDPLHDPNRIDKLVRLMIDIFHSIEYPKTSEEDKESPEEPEDKPKEQKKETKKAAKPASKSKKSSSKKSSGKKSSAGKSE